MQFEWKSFRPPEGRAWKFSSAVLDQLAQRGRIHFPDKPGATPQLKAYLSENLALNIGSVWDDIKYARGELGVFSEEAVFVTPRPLALLDRILLMASNPGDLFLDPFCGSGTALVAAQLNGRKWIGCDILPEACTIAMRRLKAECGISKNDSYTYVAQEELEQKPAKFGRTYKRLVTVEDLIAGIKPQFVLGQPIEIEETRYYELKEIKGTGAVDAIRYAANKYAVAYLNSFGGRILWGVRDRDRVAVGVHLDSEHRNKLRRLVVEKLSTIQPPISPEFYTLELHPVHSKHTNNVVPDLVIVDLTIPKPAIATPYSTSSGKFFVKTEGGVMELTGQRLSDWLEKFTDEI